jgi:hypothetical protein
VGCDLGGGFGFSSGFGRCNGFGRGLLLQPVQLFVHQPKLLLQRMSALPSESRHRSARWQCPLCANINVDRILRGEKL